MSQGVMGWSRAVMLAVSYMFEALFFFFFFFNPSTNDKTVGGSQCVRSEGLTESQDHWVFIATKGVG